VDALIRLMNTPNGLTGPMNLGNPSEFSILKLAELVIQLTNSSSEINYNPLPQDDPVRRRPDISLAKKKIGWTPEIKLQEGLVKTIAYFDNLLVNENENKAGNVNFSLSNPATRNSQSE